MERLVGQIKEGFAKAVQQASNNIAFTELPNCESLESIDRISIKLKDTIVYVLHFLLLYINFFYIDLMI